VPDEVKEVVGGQKRVDIRQKVGPCIHRAGVPQVARYSYLCSTKLHRGWQQTPQDISAG
jgi:hypothetical protein